MKTYTIHTEETAPEASKATLQGVQQTYGFVPNLFGAFAESPAAVEAYAVLSGIFEKTSFSPTERQVVLMTNNRLNDCHYCMAAHTTISQMQSLPADVVEALREGTAITDPKLEALRVFTIRVNENRGHVSDADLDAFYAEGYTQENVLEVILGTSFKVLSNYTNHIAKTPLDAAFESNAWSSEAVATAA